ncbi:MAG: ester cyclase [Pseudomonadota bacterium]
MDNAEFVAQWFEQVWCPPRNADAIDEMLAADCRLFGIRGDEPINRDGFRLVWEQFVRAFPDLSIKMLDAVSDGERCTFRARVEGIHGKGPFAFEGGGIVTIRGGKIVESHETWDFFALLAQLGAVSADALDRLLAESAATES